MEHKKPSTQYTGTNSEQAYFATCDHIFKEWARHSRHRPKYARAARAMLSILHRNFAAQQAMPPDYAHSLTAALQRMKATL